MPHPDMDALTRAFENTDYFIHDGTQWQTIRIGAPCPRRLRHWLRDNGRGRCAWLITACNPGAQALDERTNTQRDAALRNWLDSNAHAYVTADSRARDADWPPEPGVCMLDMDQAPALALARRFGQVALVAIPPTGPVRLVWT